MREWGGEVDRVQTDGGCCSALVEGWRWVGRARFAVLVGSMLVCVASLLWGLGPVGVPAASAESCPNGASRQGPSVNLPGCRVYEQITPVDKGDAIDIFGSYLGAEREILVDEGNQAYVAEDGDAILVKTDGSFAADATDSASAYVFSRGAEGWHMGVLAQLIDGPQKVEEVKLFDPRDLSAVGFVDELGTFNQLLDGDASAFQHVLLAGPAGGPYAPLFSASGRAALNPEDRVEMVGGSEDLSRVILEGENHSLALGAEAQDPETDALYETAGAGECSPAPPPKCRLVDVSPEGKPMPCGATLGQGEPGSGGAHSAVSADGSRIFFTAPEPKGSGLGCWNTGSGSYYEENPPEHEENPPELYMRENGTRTVPISVSEAGVEVGVGTLANPLLPSVFVGASSDGSKVFFMTRMRLTEGAVGDRPEIYEYNTEPGPKEKALTLVSGGPSEGLEGDVDSVDTVSSDGSAVYFSAYGDLATGASRYEPPPGGERFAPVNLYRYDTITGVTTFITTLNSDGYPAGFGGGSSWYSREFGGYGTEDEGLSSEKEWYTTGDGQFLVFGTVLPLTGFDNTHMPEMGCPNNYPGGPRPEGCFELYRYDAVTGQIVCLSCAGGAPVDGAYFARAHFESPASGPPRPISEDGEDVFFESANALVPQAIAGRVHVYEWHEGAISLISSPSDPGNAFFLGSSADGSNVFFVTHAQLSPADTDQSADVYDARVDGGFAGLTPSQCTGTGCQGVPAAPPIFATPASVTFEGVGNFTASEPPGESGVKRKTTKTAKCGRGRVKRHGKCVSRRVRKSSKGRI